jgi:hypothetical protein
MEAHEKLEQAENTEHAGGINKQIALMIAIMALFLAFSETLGKSANTEAITANINSSNMWNFFQAKTIRRTLVQAMADEMKVEAQGTKDNIVKVAMTKQIDDWQKTAARYRSEPETQEGSEELMKRAQAFEHNFDTSLARYHNYEIASAAFQIGIVLCSAAVITGMFLLAWIAGGVAILGLAFTALGLFAPHAIHLA